MRPRRDLMDQGVSMHTNSSALANVAARTRLVFIRCVSSLTLKSQPLNAKRGDRGSRAEVQDAGAQGPLVDPFRCCMPPCLRTAFCDPPATAPLLRLRLSPRSRECEQGRAREGRAKSERSREGRAETERSRESEQRRAREGQARARGRARGREGERARKQIHDGRHAELGPAGSRGPAGRLGQDDCLWRLLLHYQGRLPRVLGPVRRAGRV